MGEMPQNRKARLIRPEKQLLALWAKSHVGLPRKSPTFRIASDVGWTLASCSSLTLCIHSAPNPVPDSSRACFLSATQPGACYSFPSRNEETETERGLKPDVSGGLETLFPWDSGYKGPGIVGEGPVQVGTVDGVQCLRCIWVLQQNAQIDTQAPARDGSIHSN